MRGTETVRKGRTFLSGAGLLPLVMGKRETKGRIKATIPATYLLRIAVCISLRYRCEICSLLRDV